MIASSYAVCVVPTWFNVIINNVLNFCLILWDYEWKLSTWSLCDWQLWTIWEFQFLLTKWGWQFRWYWIPLDAIGDISSKLLHVSSVGGSNKMEKTGLHHMFRTLICEVIFFCSYVWLLDSLYTFPLIPALLRHFATNIRSFQKLVNIWGCVS